MTETSINIRPGVGILGLFPAMNYRAWYALGELVDNAIDSYLTHRDDLIALEGDNYRLRIVIDVESLDDGFIRVWDNAAGISSANYDRAFVTAEPPTDAAGLSQFGIGMKSASCWFAREWRVRTTAIGELISRTVEFDVPRIIATDSDTLEAVVDRAEPEQHFTEVRLWNLYRPPHTKTVGKMRTHLASMYRRFLRNGEVVIEFNGELLTHEDPAVLVAPDFREASGPSKRWLRTVDLTLSTGEHVTGFAGLRETGSTKEAGFSLYRHNRLIVGSGDETYRPKEVFGGTNSFRHQRIFGELDLDGFQVTHTKDGFIWGDSESELLELLTKELDSEPLPLLAQAEGFRARKASDDLSVIALKAVASTAKVLPFASEMIERQVDDQPETDAPASDFLDQYSPVSGRELELDIKGTLWRVQIETTNDPSATEWVEIRDSRGSGADRHIGIRFALSHPFTQRYGGASFEEIEGLVRLAVGVAIAETTARQSGVEMAGVIRRNLNELLSGPLSRQ